MTDLNNIITIKTNEIKPARGKLLISEPFLLDDYFKRSVILLAEHNKDGTFGLILNKPVDVSINHLLKDIPENDMKIFVGGPVSTDSIFFIHTLGKEIENSFEIMEGLYWGGDMEIIEELLKLNKLSSKNIRFFVGYSGWQAKQLDNELKRNSWVVANTNVKEILHTKPSQMWSSFLKNMGGAYSFWPNFPTDPSTN